MKEFRGPELDARFWAKVVRVGGCWLWTAATDRYGYGVYWHEGRLVRAHRHAYTHLSGEIPNGHELHHAIERGCTSRSCVNPSHLDPTTRADHPDSGPAVNRARTHCPHGHLLAGWRSKKNRKNGSRFCLACKQASDKDYYRRRANAA